MLQFEQLETARLVLKALTAADIKHLFDHYPKAEIKTILGHRSDEDYEKELYKHQNGYSTYNRDFILFFLTDKETGLLIGRCGLHNWNADHRRAELGYNMTDDEYKQKGLMTEAVGAVIDYGFNQLRLNRIEAIVGAGNVPSLKIVGRYGFVQEGVLRRHYFDGTDFEDSVFFSKLREEYFLEKQGL